MFNIDSLRFFIVPPSVSDPGHTEGTPPSVQPISNPPLFCCPLFPFPPKLLPVSAPSREQQPNYSTHIHPKWDKKSARATELAACREFQARNILPIKRLEAGHASPRPTTFLSNMWPGLDTYVLYRPSPKGPSVTLHVIQRLFRYRIIDISRKDIQPFFTNSDAEATGQGSPLTQFFP